MQHQAYMTAALVQGLQLLGREQLESTSGLFPALLTGVSARLDSPEGPPRHVHTNKSCSVNILVECNLVVSGMEGGAITVLIIGYMLLSTDKLHICHAEVCVS